MKVLVLFAGLLIGSVPVAAAAQEVIVRGTYTSNLTGRQDTWEAMVVPEAGQLRGTITVRGERVALPLGELTGDSIWFHFTAPSGHLGIISGYVDGLTLSGSYAVGDEDGTWFGTCDRALRVK
jgi:hypothetical protein